MAMLSAGIFIQRVAQSGELAFLPSYFALSLHMWRAFLWPSNLQALPVPIYHRRWWTYSKGAGGRRPLFHLRLKLKPEIWEWSMKTGMVKAKSICLACLKNWRTSELKWNAQLDTSSTRTSMTHILETKHIPLTSLHSPYPPFLFSYLLPNHSLVHVCCLSSIHEHQVLTGKELIQFGACDNTENSALHMVNTQGTCVE